MKPTGSRTLTSNAATNNAERFSRLESQVGALSATLEDFVTESKEYRQRTERTEQQIWVAIREQGDNLNRAVEKLSSAGQISWGMIVSTGGFLIALIGAGAAVNHALTEARVKQVEIRAELHQEMNQRELDRIYQEKGHPRPAR